MNRYKEFYNYLDKNWSTKTASNYASAITTISKELIEHKLLNCSIYLLDDEIMLSKLLDMYLNIDSLRKKDERGKKMYSNAIKRYVEFYNSYKEHNKVENKLSTLDTPKERDVSAEVEEVKRFKRDSKVKKNTFQNAKYLCEVNSEHKFFMSKEYEKNYVEEHHLIPLKYQDDFKYSLDVIANTICLCVVCHKLLHHGIFSEKKRILKKLYEERKDRLACCKIYISLDELYGYYK